MASIALSDLRSRLRTYLSDTNSKVWTDDSQLDLFINHAIVRFTHDVPIESSKTYTVATDQVGNANTFTLPVDFVKALLIEGYFAQSTYAERIGKLSLSAGTWSVNNEPIGFIVNYPIRGKFYLPRESAGATFTFYYGAWCDDELEEDDDTYDMGNDGWSEQAVLAYAAYLAFNPSSAMRAFLEQWSRKGDLNVGNPLEEEANRWLRLYQSLLDEFAPAPSTWSFVKKQVS